MGMCYRLANGDTSEKDVLENPKMLGTIALFNYGPILSNYKADDINQKFERVVRDIVAILAEAYQQAYEKESTTSVSNFMKTDIKYYTEIATKVVSSFRFFDGKDLKENFDLFKR